MEHIEREAMEFDVVIVGAGPAGLSAAIKIRQLAIENNLPDLSVCVVEKGSEVGAHILSGAVLEPRAMNELFPNWKEEGAPLNVPVTDDETYFLLSDAKAQKMPYWMVPKSMHNEGNYVISLGNVVRWLGQKAEELEVSIFPGFAASEVLYHEDGTVKGGFGSAILEFISEHKYKNEVELLGVPDEFIEHGSMKDLLKKVSLDLNGLSSFIQKKRH